MDASYHVVQRAVVVEVEDGRPRSARLAGGQRVAAGHHALNG